MWRATVLFVAVVMVLHGPEVIGEENAVCTTPRGIRGKCVVVRECQYVRDILHRKEFYFNDTVYVEGLKCESEKDGLPLVCCPRLSNDPGCGPISFATRIIGGNDTAIGEYPWLALLRFQARNAKMHANCAGSLISARFVLTAAHCFGSAKQKGWKLHAVRVAEWNFMNHLGSKDCKKLKDYDTPICRRDYDVARIAIHPGYKINYAVHINDIALIELVAPVEYNSFVAPICLPLGDAVQRPSNATTPVEYTAAGWGSTAPGAGMSYLLKQINLKQFDIERCRKLFEVPNGNGINEAHICAGGLYGEDTCHGDSGGPLMEVIDNRWYLPGVTSFGWPKCGRDGIPGVYTNVSHFLGWIEYEVFRGISV